MSRQSSQKRIEANRRNALKSTGPRTPEGKARSAQNATTHGFSRLDTNPLNPHCFLHMEDEARFLDLLNRYLALYQPQQIDELELVNEAVYAKWRQQRLWIAETTQLEVAIALHETDFTRELSTATSAAHLANAFAKSETQFKLYLRYDAQLRRHYRQCLQDLQDLQASRLPLDDSPLDPPSPQPEPQNHPEPQPQPQTQPPTTPNPSTSNEPSTPNEPNLTSEPAHPADRKAEIQRFAEPSRALRAQRDGEIA